MRIYYATCDYGDGTNGVSWFKTFDVAMTYMDDEEYYGNEGQPRGLNLPDDFDLDTLGVRFIEDRKDG